MSTIVQLVGFLLVVAFGWLVWSVWALLIGGLLLLLVPEIVTAIRRSSRAGVTP